MAKAANPRKKMHAVLKSTLIGAGLGALATAGALHDARIRRGHADLAEGSIHVIKEEIRKRDLAPPNVRRTIEENRILFKQKPLEAELAQAERTDGKYAKQERAREAKMLSFAKYPILAGAAVGFGVGALMHRRKKKLLRRTQHRR